MEMTLQDIIKMSKKNTVKGKKPPKILNKSRASKNGGRTQGNSYKVQRFLESRSSIRQGVLARRRSNVPGGQFPLTTDFARKAVNIPILNRKIYSSRPRVGQWNGKISESKASVQKKVVPKQRQTLDARFADMREQRIRVTSERMGRGGVNLNASRQHGQQQWQPQQQGRVGAPHGGAGRRFDNFPRY